MDKDSNLYRWRSFLYLLLCFKEKEKDAEQEVVFFKPHFIYTYTKIIIIKANSYQLIINIIRSLLLPRLCFKHFTDISRLNSHNSPMKWFLQMKKLRYQEFKSKVTDQQVAVPGFEPRMCGTKVYAFNFRATCHNVIDMHHNFICMCHHQAKFGKYFKFSNNDFSDV